MFNPFRWKKAPPGHNISLDELFFGGFCWPKNNTVWPTRTWSIKQRRLSQLSRRICSTVKCRVITQIRRLRFYWILQCSTLAIIITCDHLTPNTTNKRYYQYELQEGRFRKIKKITCWAWKCNWNKRTRSVHTSGTIHWRVCKMYKQIVDHSRQFFCNQLSVTANITLDIPRCRITLIKFLFNERQNWFLIIHYHQHSVYPFPGSLLQWMSIFEIMTKLIFF